jgi:hypothetical protein
MIEKFVLETSATVNRKLICVPLNGYTPKKIATLVEALVAFYDRSHVWLVDGGIIANVLLYEEEEVADEVTNMDSFPASDEDEG